MTAGKGRIPLVVYSGQKTELIGRVWVRQRVAGEIIRGHQRTGIKAGNLRMEAVLTNEKTSPRVEVPRVVIETMRIESNTVSANDIALFWRLFAHARLNGMGCAIHSIRMSDLRHYLGYRSSARVHQCLKRLATAGVSFDFGRGRPSVSMIELADVSNSDVEWMRREPGFRKGDELVHFSLPENLRGAVLQSREYAWVDINALPRFACKYTAAVYLRLCLAAGRSRACWRNFSISKAALKRSLGMPRTIREKVFQDAMRLMEADLNGISGPRKRFDVAMGWPSSIQEDDVFEFSATASARKLREVAPAELPDDERKRVADRKTVMLERSEMPSILRLRQSTTLARQTRGGISVLSVRDMWARDVNYAKWLGRPTAGMAAAEFLGLISEDIDYALEVWTDRTDFGVEFILEPVSVEPPREAEPKKLSLHDIPGAIVQYARYSPSTEDDDEEDHDADDIKLVEDYPEIHEVPYDGEEPPDFGAFDDDGDDYDIAA